MDTASTINDAARLNRGVLPTDYWSSYVIPQFVFVGSVPNSVQSVGDSPELRCASGEMFIGGAVGAQARCVRIALDVPSAGQRCPDGSYADFGMDCPVQGKCPPGQVWSQPQCIRAPCPGFCISPDIVTPKHYDPMQGPPGMQPATPTPVLADGTPQTGALFSSTIAGTASSDMSNGAGTIGLFGLVALAVLYLGTKGRR